MSYICHTLYIQTTYTVYTLYVQTAAIDIQMAHENVNKTSGYISNPPPNPSLREGSY
jgi:hypothetical protein